MQLACAGAALRSTPCLVSCCAPPPSADQACVLCQRPAVSCSEPQRLYRYPHLQDAALYEVDENIYVDVAHTHQRWLMLATKIFLTQELYIAVILYKNSISR
jgi:hypothetical protein